MNQLLVLLAEVTAVFAVALLGARLASRARAAIRHLMLAAAFGVVLVLPLATLVSPPVVVEISVLPARTAGPAVSRIVAPINAAPSNFKTAQARTATATATTTMSEATTTTPMPSVRSAPLPASTWLLLAWGIVALLALLPVCASLWNLRSIRRRSQRWPGGAAQLKQLALTAGRQRATVLVSDGIAAPIAGGVLHPVVIFPADAVTWSEAQIANALRHELEHVRRHDWAVHLVTRTVCALYWFHPLAWVAWRTLCLEAERACDDAVLKRADAATYAEQLLSLARRLVDRPRLPGLQMASGSTLATRIKAVLDDAQPRGRAGRMRVAAVAIAAVLALALLAPLRAAAPQQAQQIAAPPARSFVYAERIGLANWWTDNRGCVAVFNSSVTPGTRVTLVDQSLASDPPGFTEATVVERVTKACDKGLGMIDDGGVAPSFYLISTARGARPSNGLGFALVNAPAPVSLRNGLVETDLDGDGVNESFSVCTSTENVHFLVWSGSPAQGRARWHGNYYVGYDMEPSCTTRDIAGMQNIDTSIAVTRIEPPARSSPPRVDAPQTAVVASILALVQSALADATLATLDEINRPITGLHHVQRHAAAVLNDGDDPATLAENYLEVINALTNTANMAEGVASRQPGSRSSPEFRKLAAAMHEKSSALAAAVMPVPAVTSINVSSPERRVAIAALDLAQTIRADTQFVGPRGISWLVTELDTLERAAQSVVTDDGANRPAALLKMYMLKSSVAATTRQVSEITRRAAAPAAQRSKASGLVTTLRDIALRVDSAIPPKVNSPALPPDTQLSARGEFIRVNANAPGRFSRYASVVIGIMRKDTAPIPSSAIANVRIVADDGRDIAWQVGEGYRDQSEMLMVVSLGISGSTMLYELKDAQDLVNIGRVEFTYQGERFVFRLKP